MKILYEIVHLQLLIQDVKKYKTVLTVEQLYIFDLMALRKNDRKLNSFRKCIDKLQFQCDCLLTRTESILISLYSVSTDPLSCCLKYNRIQLRHALFHMLRTREINQFLSDRERKHDWSPCVPLLHPLQLTGNSTLLGSPGSVRFIGEFYLMDNRWRWYSTYNRRTQKNCSRYPLLLMSRDLKRAKMERIAELIRNLIVDRRG
ncbi:hypothetical protein HNY73_010902 [Argiope bruennichi]|uniref:Uncharacterized protein n=1 Tax=Argiope bruennichi TaxID=94029 RepID=A0A8T0F7C3_ARGBR|nr:hypothetical protein HNY73_010902 [Argiope bruennichi]